MSREKLPIKFKEKWIVALRSNKYKQDSAEGLLETLKGKFCCLGVACKVAGISSRDYRLSRSWIDGDGKFPGVPKLLIGDGKYGSTIEKLSSMNDSGDSFKKIAKWIEKNL